jgi:hypothetical protein
VGGPKRYELWAEAIRDVGILLLVFEPLDTLLKTGRGSETDWLIAVTVAIMGLLFVFIGVTIGSDQ